MKNGACRASLDRFRLAAALLVIAIHVSPLTSLSVEADFWLTRVCARIAVPFFFMTTGYFLARNHWQDTSKFVKRTALLYLAAVLLYLPLNLYNGGFSPGEALRRLFFDGTFYHLWYFPAIILGVIIMRGLRRLGPRAAFGVAAALYLIGLGGDSYWGLASSVPALRGLYGAVFALFSYTRNGLFFAPLFLLLGAAGLRLRPRVSALGFALSLAAMSAEAFWLRGLGAQRHDSMYALLPLCMVFLFSMLLRRNNAQNRAARRVSALVYVLHPWCIVLVRGAAKLTRTGPLFIENSLGHFFAVATLSLALACGLYALRPLRPAPTGRAWREIDLGALRHNADALAARLAPGCALMAVVKADAYGHGAALVARALRRHGVRAFAVACLSEGVALRRAGVRGTILVLGWTPAAEVPLLRRWRLTQAVADEAHARALSAQGRRVRVHLALDTGMHRLGVPADDTEALRRVFALPHLRVEGVFSHLCVSDSSAPEDVRYTARQAQAFWDAVGSLRSAGLPPGLTHLQASYGVLNLPPQPCAYARVGIALYGVRSDDAPVQFPTALRPVLALRVRVASVRALQPGERAGYGLSFTAARPTVLAVLAIGYADGLPRDLARRGGEVLLGGVRAPIVGRLCMDQLLVDATGLPEVRPGDVATLLGTDGGETIRAEALAAQCGTITNELLSRLSPRLPCVPRGV